MADRRNVSDKRDRTQVDPSQRQISQLKLNCILDFADEVLNGNVQLAEELIFHYWKVGFQRGFRGQKLCLFASEKAYQEVHGINQ